MRFFNLMREDFRNDYLAQENVTLDLALLEARAIEYARDRLNRRREREERMANSSSGSDSESSEDSILGEALLEETDGQN